MSPDGHCPRTLPLIVILDVITALDAMAIRPISADLSRHRPALSEQTWHAMQTSLAVFVDGAAIGQLSEEE
jgi:hypothetical protein